MYRIPSIIGLTLAVAFFMAMLAAWYVLPESPKDANYFLHRLESDKRSYDAARRELFKDKKKAVPILLEILSRKKSENARGCLVAIGDEAVSEVLFLVKQDQDLGQRCEYLGILAEMVAYGSATNENRFRIVETLSAALSDELLPIRQTAAKGLYYVGKHALPALPQLRRTLQDPDLGVSLYSAWAISNLTREIDDVIEVLSTVLAGNDKYSQIWVLEMIGFQHIASDEIVDSIVNIIKRYGDDRQVHALYSLERLSSQAKRAAPYVRSLATNANVDEELRRSASKALDAISK
jgi:hypothetical protein